MTSQIFGNIYLNEFDRFVRNTLKPLGYVRYGDDFALFVSTKEQAEDAQRVATNWLSDNLHLKVHTKNNVVIKTNKGLQFLGHQIYPMSDIAIDRTMSKKIEQKSENEEADGEYDYFSGLVNFEVSCATQNGFTMPVSIIFHGVTFSEDFVLRKYNPNTDEYFTVDEADIFQDEIDGQPVVVAEYSILDGGELDMDGVANGSVTDPVGLAVVASESTLEDELAETGSNTHLFAILAYTTCSVATLALAYQYRKRLRG